MQRIDDASEVYRPDDQHVDVASLGLGRTRNRAENKCHVDPICQRLEGLRNHVGQPGRFAQNSRELLENWRVPVCAINKLVTPSLAVEQPNFCQTLQLACQLPGGQSCPSGNLATMKGFLGMKHEHS